MSQVNTTSTPVGAEAEQNIEWELHDLVDAIAAEIDRAEDTLSLKSYARGIMFALKQLSLDVAVSVRRDQQGRVLFQTAGPAEPATTVLKLDFAQVIESQLQGLRKPLDDQVDATDVRTLARISEAEVRALNAFSIYSLDDLARSTRTAAMIDELSRKTNIANWKLRLWRQFPYLSEVRPGADAPGSLVTLVGGNFGAGPTSGDTFWFQGAPLALRSWSDTRITATIPAGVRGAGMLYGKIGTQLTNSLPWEAVGPDLQVAGITLTPAVIEANMPFVAEAELSNRGLVASGPFQVQWIIDGEAQPEIAHRSLDPGQRSTEPGVRRQIVLPYGRHRIKFVADPEGILHDLDHANGTCVAEVDVRQPQPIESAILFDDSFAKGWVERWSWDADMDAAVESPRYSGSVACGVRYTAPWGGFRLMPTEESDDWSGYRTLRFALNGGPQGGQLMKVWLKAGPGHAVDLGVVKAPADTWVVVELALPNDPALSGVTELIWQEAAGIAPPELYLDRVELAKSTSGVSDPMILLDGGKVEQSWVERWSWNVEQDPSVEAPHYKGATSYGVRFTAPWGGFRLMPVAGSVNWSGYRTLRFALNGGPQGGQQVKAWLKTTAGRAIDLGLVIAPADRWAIVEFALPHDPALAGVTELIWQEAMGATPPMLFLDAIELVL